MLQKEYITLKIKDIIPYKNNNKIHTAESVKEVAKSIEKNGDLAPMIIDEENILIAGHGRLKAFKKLKYKEVKVLKISGLSEEQKKDYRIRDNTTNFLSEWNFESLQKEILSLGEDSFDLFGHLDGLDGFDTLNFGNEEFKEEIQDEVPELEEGEKIEVKKGDIFKLGNHYLMCGSSTSGKDVEKLLNGSLADCVLTDPPYLMNFEGAIDGEGNKSNKHNHKKIENDNLKGSEGQKFLQDFLKQIKNNCSGAYYIFFYRLGIDKIFKAMEEEKMKWRNLIIWKKNHMNLSPTDYKSIYEPIVNGWADDYQPIFYGWNEDHVFYGRKGETDVIDDIQVSSVLENERTQHNDLHPTMKPIKLLEKILNNSTRIGDKVLDLFGGSGSTLIACEKKQRVCYMMELDEEYCQTIIKRFYKVINGSKKIKCLNRNLELNFLQND